MVYHGENISPNRVDTTMKLSLKCYLLYPSPGITLQTVSAYFSFHKKNHRYFTTAPFISSNAPRRKVKGLTQWYNFTISSCILFALISSSFIKFSGAANRRNVRKANNMDRIFLGYNVVQRSTGLRKFRFKATSAMEVQIILGQSPSLSTT